MIQFTNQTSFNNDRRFIVIEDINQKCIKSAKALLKSIEEPNNQIYYILINNSEFKILETIKSRCLEFKSNLKNSEVVEIVNYYFNSDIYNEINLDFINNYNFTLFIKSSIIFLLSFIAFCIFDQTLIFRLLNLQYFISIFILILIFLGLSKYGKE